MGNIFCKEPLLISDGTVPEKRVILSFPEISSRNSTERLEVLNVGSIVLDNINERDILYAIKIVGAFHVDRR